ncbi:hypothetical protein ACHAWX_006599 [Stephanocyclus meneghinianus]
MTNIAFRFVLFAFLALPCLAFVSPLGSTYQRELGLSPSSLSASSTSHDESDRSLIRTRRSFLGHAIGATAVATLSTTPLIVCAEEDTPPAQPPSSVSSKRPPLSSCIYNILRVREATQQETRLITTGKFKDVQRANVKLAVKFMINNYRLSDSIVAASSYLTGNAKVSASGVGGSAVQSLYTILEYFDSSDVENIKVGSDSIAGKEGIVTKGLESVRRDIDDFLSYFPQDVVDQAKAKIAEENELNFKEFDPELGTILNPNPK